MPSHCRNMSVCCFLMPSWSRKALGHGRLSHLQVLSVFILVCMSRSLFYGHEKCHRGVQDGLSQCHREFCRFLPPLVFYSWPPAPTKDTFWDYTGSHTGALVSGWKRVTWDGHRQVLLFFCRLSCASVCRSEPRICSDAQSSVGFSVRFIGFFVMRSFRSNCSLWWDNMKPVGEIISGQICSNSLNKSLTSIQVQKTFILL